MGYKGEKKDGVSSPRQCKRCSFFSMLVQVRDFYERWELFRNQLVQAPAHFLAAQAPQGGERKSSLLPASSFHLL